MIKVENVSFKYKNSEKNILNDLNFVVNEGEILAIVGKNGSGKSTIGKLLSGITKLKNGSITIDDLKIKDKEAKNKVGIVFQNPENQIIFNSIYDELSFSLKGLEKTEIENRIEKSLEQVGMLEYKNCDLYNLSLGQKQRIMIAEMLSKKPKYIILDEPTTMIDSIGKQTIHKIIKNLKQEGYTVICITNLADEILIADRTLILKDGRIIEEIKKQELLEKYYLFKQNEIKEPMIIEILARLKENGINIKLNEFTVDELIEKLRRIIK